VGLYLSEMQNLPGTKKASFLLRDGRMKKAFFFIKNTVDFHLLICLIENWPRYAKNVDKFYVENLDSLTLATTWKLFTLAKFYRVPERRDSFDVLKKLDSIR
jgi:hypothetical protein